MNLKAEAGKDQRRLLDAELLSVRSSTQSNNHRIPLIYGGSK